MSLAMSYLHYELESPDRNKNVGSNGPESGIVQIQATKNIPIYNYKEVIIMK